MFWLAKDPSSSDWQKPLSGKNASSICDVYQCIVAIGIAQLCILFAGGPGVNVSS
jgi:hypothetical protein